MTLGAILTVVFACLHWIDGASTAISGWPTIYVFLPMIIEFSLYGIMIILSIVGSILEMKGGK